jgi:hypothetical protein
MTRPSFLDRYPIVGPIAVVVVWLAMGILEGLGY